MTETRTTGTGDDEHPSGPVIAEGVDEEPIEGNRRLFEGGAFLFVATLSTLYAAFHMAALNGVSISAWTARERSRSAAGSSTRVRPADWYKDAPTARLLVEEWVKFRLAALRGRADQAARAGVRVCAR